MTTSVIQKAFHTPVGPVSLQRKNASGSIIAINLHRDIISDGMPMPSPSSAPDEVTDTAEIIKPIQIRRSAVLPMAIVSALSVKSPMSLAGKSAHMIVPPPISLLSCKEQCGKFSSHAPFRLLRS